MFGIHDAAAGSHAAPGRADAGRVVPTRVPMAPPGLRVRPVGHGELDLVLEWADAEGWSPGRADAGTFWATDPGGFIVAELEGGPVGAISAVRYGAEYGVIGLHIVRPPDRGRGIGHSLWLHAMARLAGRTISIDGREDQAHHYAQWGFVPSHGLVRFRARAAELARGAPIPTRPARDIPMPRLQALDRCCFPAPRAAFLRRWIGPPHRALVAEHDGAAVGFGVIRPCHDAHRVGPLVARDARTARGLLRALVAPLEDAWVLLDVPDANPAATALATRLGMAPVMRRTRMYTGPPPTIGIERVYGVTTLDLG